MEIHLRQVSFVNFYNIKQISLSPNEENKVRRSSRKRIQRMAIESDEIGDCDNENDPDYKS